MGTNVSQSKSSGIGKAWLATIVLGGVLFICGSVRFFAKVSDGSTAYYRWRSDVNLLWERAENLGGFPYPTTAALLMAPAAGAGPMVGGGDLAGE